jgi:hypothetical protein
MQEKIIMTKAKHASQANESFMDSPSDWHRAYTWAVWDARRCMLSH